MLVVVGLAGLVGVGLATGRQLAGWLARETRRLEAEPLRDGLVDAAWSGLLDLRDARSRDLVDHYDEFARTGVRPVAARHGRRRADAVETGSLAMSLLTALVPADELPVGASSRSAWRLLADYAPSSEQAEELNRIVDQAKERRRASSSPSVAAILLRVLFGGRSGADRRSGASDTAVTAAGAPGRKAGRLSGLPRQRQPQKVLHALRPPKVRTVVRTTPVTEPGDDWPVIGLIDAAKTADVEEPVVLDIDDLDGDEPAAAIDLDADTKEREIDLDVDLMADLDVDPEDGLDCGLGVELDSDVPIDRPIDPAVDLPADVVLDRAAEPAELVESDPASNDATDREDAGNPELRLDAARNLEIPESERPTQQIQRVLPVPEPGSTPTAIPAGKGRSVDLRDGHFTPRHP